ncbi:helix-turn-helix domain-containing protein [Paenibacillus roseus]|uniref:Helix-turn-helix transcriptional regulator n=1 Tax=Paenibacillus roseus TaxID=2798579 RepID=A0A934MNB2_9BACL|nr:AraC family transcriptional regulator [Paenibacillus roseus]MBJ6364285.1 helix-turn-helix transcriptional regulator [Paenibacillus roseus]
MEAGLLMCGFSHHTQLFSHMYEPNRSGYLFRLQTEGRATALVNGAMREITGGDLLLYAPEDPYQLTISPFDHPQRGRVISSSDYYLSCYGGWIDKWWKRRKRPQLIRIDPEDRLLSLWRNLILERRAIGGDQPELTDYMLRSLCLSIDRKIDEQSSQQGRLFIASRMKAYIEEHATSSMRVEDLANHVQLSVSRASHLFKEYVGKSIIEYALEIRLSVAEERIKYSSMTLEQIAETCGFGSYSYFFRIFRRKHGISPAEFRRSFTSGISLTTPEEQMGSDNP